MKTYLLKPGVRQAIAKAGETDIAVAYNAKEWLDDYPAGTPQLMVTRPDGVRVPVTVTVTDNLIAGQVPNELLVNPGLYSYVFVWTSGATQMESGRCECMVLGSELAKTWADVRRAPDWAERIFLAAGVIEGAFNGAMEARNTAADKAAEAAASAETAGGYKDDAADSAEAAAASEGNIETILTNMEQTITDATTAMNGIEAQKNTMIASIAAIAEMGTDPTLTQEGVAADARAAGELKSAADNLIELLDADGKNLLNPVWLADLERGNDPLYTLIGDSVTVEWSDYSTIAATDKVMVLNAGTYTISYENSCRCGVFADGVKIEDFTGTSKTFTIDDDDTNVYLVFFASSYPYTIGHIQVEQGASATEYVKYGPFLNSKRLESSEARVDYLEKSNTFLRNAADNLVTLLDADSKNLLNPEWLADLVRGNDPLYTLDGDSVTVEWSDFSTVSASDSVLKLDAGEYTISYENSCRCGIFVNGNKEEDFTGTSKTFTIDDDDANVYLVFLASSYPYTIGHIQIERGNAATAYEKYGPFVVSNLIDSFCTNPGIKNIGVDPVSIVFIGDSIVEGYGSSDYNGGSAVAHSDHVIPNRSYTWYRNTGSRCWTNKMIAYMQSNYANVTACNNGVGGLTPTDVYNSIDLLAQNDDGTTPDYVVLSVGTNAGRYTYNLKTDVVTPIINIINWLRTHGITPIVLTNTPYTQNTTNKPQAVQSAIIAACNMANVRCYTVLSALNYYIWEHNVPIGPSADHQSFLIDEVHPSDLGYEIMFQMLKKTLSL